MREKKNRLRHVADFALDEKGLILRHEVDRILRRDIAIIHDRKARGIEVELYRVDAAARNSRANRPAMKHARKHEIISVSRRACGLPDTIFARHTRANCFHWVKMLLVIGAGKLQIPCNGHTSRNYRCPSKRF